MDIAFKKIINILNSQLYAISLYSRQIAGTIVIFLIARYLSVYDFGLFSSYKNIAAFCFMFANLGFSEYILVSSKANPTQVKLKISLFMTNAVFVGFLMCFGSIFFNLESNFLFWLVVIRTFFDGVFFALILPYFQATKKFNIIAIINIIYAICISLIALLSFIFKLSLTNFLILNIVLGLINFIQCSYYAKINYFLLFNNLKKFLRMIDKSIYAYIGVTVAYFLYAQVPSLYVSTYLPKEDAALYFSAYTIATVIMLLSNAQVQKIVPELIKTSPDQSRLIIKKNLLFVLGFAMIVLLFVSLFGKFILGLLYGQDYYKGAVGILLILIVANICCAEGAIYGAYLTASGRQKKKIPIQIETTFITIAGLFILHRFGVFGAAYAFLCSAIYISSRYILYTRKVLKTDETDAQNKENLNEI